MVGVGSTRGVQRGEVLLMVVGMAGAGGRWEHVLLWGAVGGTGVGGGSVLLRGVVGVPVGLGRLLGGGERGMEALVGKRSGRLGRVNGGNPLAVGDLHSLRRKRRQVGRRELRAPGDHTLQ